MKVAVTGFWLAIAAVTFGSDNVVPITEASFPPMNNVLLDGEELIYEVSWTMFKLGMIRVRSRPDRTAFAWIDSYDLPFVDLHSMYQTSMDSNFFSLASYSLDKADSGWSGLRYTSDPLNRRVYIEKVRKKTPGADPYELSVVDTISFQTLRFVDGLSISYLPRLLLHSNQSVSVPTILKGKRGSTTFHFAGKRVKERIGALNDPVRVVEVKGTTDVVGIYGMTGDFTGWFSDDSSGVPIKGRLKVLIGSVTVELIQWNRKGWRPPT